ncbi:hypothetical protein BX666DRAFT_1924161 [Dichotomocladium elegans]|nr:hypothetical protein BX666DRAFT_1924161 [Dichotomocladium elegans]
MREKVKPSTKAIRTLIRRHLEDYTKSADIEPGQHCSMSQVATYLRFGECFRRAINILLNVRQRKEDLRKEMVNKDEHGFRQPTLAELSPILQPYSDTYAFAQDDIYQCLL